MGCAYTKKFRSFCIDCLQLEDKRVGCFNINFESIDIYIEVTGIFQALVE